MSYKSRNNHGEFVSKRTQLVGIFSVMIVTTAVSGALMLSQPVKAEKLELISPVAPYEKQPSKIRDISKIPRVTIAPPFTVEGKIRAKFGTNAEKMIAIAKCESGLRPDAVGDHKLAFVKNGTTYGKSYGLFQVRHLPGRVGPSSLLDPDTNIDIAYQLSHGGKNTTPWVTCSRKVGV